MSKTKNQIKVQITFDLDAHSHLLKVIKDANSSFTDGTVNMSQCVNFAVLNAKYNKLEIQKKSTNTPKLMQNIFQEAGDDEPLLVETLLKFRSDIQSKKQKVSSKKVEVIHET